MYLRNLHAFSFNQEMARWLHHRECIRGAADPLWLAALRKCRIPHPRATGQDRSAAELAHVRRRPGPQHGQHQRPQSAGRMGCRQGQTGQRPVEDADLGSRSYGGPIVAGGKVFVGTNNQAPRDKKHRAIRTPEWGDVITKIGDQPVKDSKETQEVIAGLPHGKPVECTYVSKRDGRTHTANLPVVPIDLGVLMAFNQADGKFLYQTVFPKLINGQVNDWPLEGLCSAPAFEEGRLYFTSNRCEVVCTNADTGAIVWKLDMMAELGVFPHNMTACSPLIVGDDLYVITANGVDEGHLNIPAPKAPSFLKLNKRNGNVLWQDNSPTIKALLAKNNPALLRNLVDRGEIIQHGQWSHPAYAVVDGQPQVIFPAGDGWIRSFTPREAALEVRLQSERRRVRTWASRHAFRFHRRSGDLQEPRLHRPRPGSRTQFGRGPFLVHRHDEEGRRFAGTRRQCQCVPPVVMANPNSAAVWHFGGFINGKPKKGRSLPFRPDHVDLCHPR